MKKEIAIYGAFDRFNYGDLLFPLVLEAAFSAYEDYELCFYSLRSGDLSQYGGRPSRGIGSLFRKNRLADGNLVIVAGGEVLDCSWFELYKSTLPSGLNIPLKALGKLVAPGFLDTVSRRRFASNLDLPFVIDSEDFSGKALVAYNAVGGSGLRNLPLGTQTAVRKKLGKAAYLAVRDTNALSTLVDEEPTVSATLVPDSAALISELYPKEKLEDLVSRETREIIARFPDGYFCFQVSEDHSKKSESLIVEELRKVKKTTGLGIVLLPIGRAARHDDQVPLSRIKKKLGTLALLPEKNGIYDIMALIANARVFAGTSLHGNITAMSFCVPYLGLTDLVPKLDAYLRTWAVPELDHCIPFSLLSRAVGDALTVSVDALKENKDELAAASWANLFQMKQSLGLEAAA